MKENYVLLGGWGRIGDSYQKVVQMSPNNTRFIVISYGLIVHNSQNFSLDAINAKILKEIRKSGLSSVALIGHSLGGGIAISFATSHPEYIKKLFLIDSEGVPQKRSLFLAVLYWFYDSIFIHGLDKARENLKALYRIIRNFKYYLTLERHADNLNVSKEAKRIDLPTIIIWGEKDRVTPLKSGKELNKLILNSKLKILSGMNHDWILHYPQGLWENI